VDVARREFGIQHLLLDGLDCKERDRKEWCAALDAAAARLAVQERLDPP
jgi:hypothetical protein